MRSVNNFAASLKFGKDRLSGSGPHEWLGMLLVMVDQGGDLALEVADRIEPSHGESPDG